jgi:UDP-N-acetylmuramoyl-tripeptide--D-alanyl-D-alanine ligase
MTNFTGEEFGQWSSGRWDPAPPRIITGVSHDTRALSTGELYFALKGKRVDGHDFIGTAFSNGAVGAVVEDNAIVGTDDRPVLHVDNTLKALQRAAVAYRKEVGIESIAITGTVGKSTVKEMTADIFASVLPTARTRGNFNTDIGLPLSILAMDRNSRFGVFELGMSHAGEIAPLCSLIDPVWGVVTNVGPGHLEFFDSVADIADEKAELLKALPADGTALLWKDCEFFDRLRTKTRSQVLTVSADAPADYECRRVDAAAGTAVITERATGDSLDFTMAMPGKHNVINATFAAAIARGHGIEWDAIRAALNAFSPLPQRGATQEVAGVTFINDAYNANPVSMKAALDTFAEATGYRHKWLVLSEMLELGPSTRDAHMQLGGFAGVRDWAGIIAIGEAGGWIAQGATEANYDPQRITQCADNSEAASALMTQVTAGDAVLLKASRGMHLEEVLEECVAGSA